MTTIRPGDIYEDCAYHPVLCTEVEDDGDSVSGISLLDGSMPRSCSVAHCGVVRLTIEDVVRARGNWTRWLEQREAAVASGDDPVR